MQPSTELQRQLAYQRKDVIKLPYYLPVPFSKHLLLSIAEDKKLGGLQQAFGKTPCSRLCFYAATFNNTSLCHSLPFVCFSAPFTEAKKRKSSPEIYLEILTSDASKYLGASSCPSVAISTISKQTHALYSFKSLHDQGIRDTKVRKHS